MSRRSLNNIIEGVKNIIELEKETGLDEVMMPAMLKDAKKEIEKKWPSDTKSEIAVSFKDKAKALEELQKQAHECKECSLHSSRRSLVFGKGNPDAMLMFVGEAPGLEEDIQGEPFVGKAGALLTKIIEAIGLRREDVYIANCLKCRPPQNRNPLPSEIVACRGFLMKQINVVKPKVMCCLGKFSAQTLLMSEEPITKLRGKFYEFEGIKVMPTFHPAYLLRNPGDKRLTWEDMKKVRDYINRWKK